MGKPRANKGFANKAKSGARAAIARHRQAVSAGKDRPLRGSRLAGEGRRAPSPPRGARGPRATG